MEDFSSRKPVKFGIYRNSVNQTRTHNTIFLRAFRLPVVALMLVATLLSCKSPEQAVIEVGVKAYYIDKKEMSTVRSEGISMSIETGQLIKLVSDVVRENFKTTTNVVSAADVQVNDRNPAFAKPIFKIITPPIPVKNEAEFRRLFKMGEYIVDRPGFKVNPEDFQFSIDAIVSHDGNNLNIQFRANGYVNWVIYKQNKSGEWLQEQESMKPYYGVGSYRFARDEVTTNKKGKEKRTTVWEEVTVNDRPRSLGVLENELVNATLEMAAIRSFKATILTIY
jgi:hypothetical protein